MELCGVYTIRNLVDGKLYVGSTRQFRKRKNSHLCTLRKGLHINSHLQRAFTLYGEAVFCFALEEQCSPDSLEALEQKWLDRYFANGNLYNSFRTAYSVSGENHPMFGRVHKSQSRDKIKAARAKQKISHSLETRRKMGAKSKGRRLSAEAIEKIRQAKIGSRPWNLGLTSNDNPRLINKYQILFSEAQLVLLLNRYAEGASINELSREFNCDWEVARRHLRTAGVRTRTIREQKIIRDKGAINVQPGI